VKGPCTSVSWKEMESFDGKREKEKKGYQVVHSNILPYSI
jgi:hypothetical protein